MDVRCWPSDRHGRRGRNQGRPTRSERRDERVTATEPMAGWSPLLAVDDPYPVYRHLRDEAPLYHDERIGLWVLSRFADVQQAAKDWESYSSSAGGRGNDIDDTYQLFLPAGDLAGVDPPPHTRLRAALRPAFSPSALQPRFEPIVRAKVVELIEGFADQGHADFARDLARPLP